jgi:hypothetical protein
MRGGVHESRGGLYPSEHAGPGLQRARADESVHPFRVARVAEHLALAGQAQRVPFIVTELGADAAYLLYA